MTKRYSRIVDFYPFYLSEHQNRTCRRLHIVGTSLGLALFAGAIVKVDIGWLLAGLIAGHACAWVGHFYFERNRPATFRHPLYSLAGDWIMWSQILRGKIRF